MFFARVLKCPSCFITHSVIHPLQHPVTWYGINYVGTQITQWNFQTKGKSGWTGKSSFVLEIPLRYLRPSVIYSVPFDRMQQRAYTRLRLRYIFVKKSGCFGIPCLWDRIAKTRSEGLEEHEYSNCFQGNPEPNVFDYIETW